MTADQAGYQNRILEVRRALDALEALEKNGFHTGVAAAVMNAKAAYRRLHDHQRDAGLTTEQAVLVQTTLETLRAQLQALGYPA